MVQSYLRTYLLGECNPALKAGDNSRCRHHGV